MVMYEQLGTANTFGGLPVDQAIGQSAPEKTHRQQRAQNDSIEITKQ